MSLCPTLPAAAPDRLLPGCLLLFCLLLAGCTTTPEERAARYLASAEALLAAGDIERARLEARNAAQIQPKNAQVRYVLAQIAEQRGEIGDMVEQLLIAVDSDPDYLPAKVRLATIMVFMQQYEDAQAIADEALAQAPDNPAVQILAARLEFQRGETGAGFAALDRALALEPANPEAWLIRATARLAADEAAGLAEFEQAIDVVGAPANRTLRQARLDLLLALGRLEEGEAALRGLLADFPEEGYAGVLASLLAGQGRTGEAEAVLAEVVAANPDAEPPKIALAQFQSRVLRDPEQAIRTLQRYIAEDPRNPAWPLVLGSLFEGLGRDREAADFYRDVAQRWPRTEQSIDARNRLAALKLRERDVAAARATVDSVLAEVPDNPQALLYRAEMQLAAGELLPAIGDLRLVLRREPDAPLALLLIAEAHTAIGERGLAIDAYRRLLQANPRSPDGLRGLGRLLLADGQPAEAEPLLVRLLEVQPEDPVALAQLSDLYLADGRLEQAGIMATRLAGLPGRAGPGHWRLGLVQQAQGQLPAAEQSFRASLAAIPGAAEPLEVLTRLIAETRGDAAASRFLEEHLKAHPGLALPRVLLGTVRLRAADAAGARELYTAAIAHEPALVVAHTSLAGTWPPGSDERLAVLREAVDALPGDTTLALLLGTEYRQLERVDEAITLYEAVLEANPAALPVANNLAMLLLDSRDDEASHRRALRIAQGFASTRDPVLLDTLGWAYYRNGNSLQAVQHLERVVAASPEPLFRFHLAQAYIAAQNPVGARDQLERALSVDGDFRWRGAAEAALATL